MLELTFSGSEERVKLWLKSVGAGITTALFTAMQKQMIGLRNYVVANKLSGQVLNTKTGTLRRSQFSDATQDGSTILGMVATDPSATKYGKIHEYGGTFTVREHLRKTTRGTRTVRAHSVSYPERSFLRSALLEQSETIVAGLQEAVNVAIKENS